MEEEKDLNIEIIKDFPDGNFLYNTYVHSRLGHFDIINIFDVKKNETHKLRSFSEFDHINWSNIVCFPNGFAFSSSSYSYLTLSTGGEDKYRYYLHVVKGFGIKTINFDFFGDIKSIRYENEKLYLLNKLNAQHIFDLKNCIAEDKKVKKKNRRR